MLPELHFMTKYVCCNHNATETVSNTVSTHASPALNGIKTAWLAGLGSTQAMTS